MLVRSHKGDIISVNRSDYITNTDYYKKIMQIKFNHHNVPENKQIKNIISTILYG